MVGSHFALVTLLRGGPVEELQEKVETRNFLLVSIHIQNIKPTISTSLQYRCMELTQIMGQEMFSRTPQNRFVNNAVNREHERIMTRISVSQQRETRKQRLKFADLMSELTKSINSMEQSPS